MAEETLTTAETTTVTKEVVVVKDLPMMAEKPAEQEAVASEEAAAELEKETAGSASFKEESNVVGELPESEKKALDELKQLVQEALNKRELTAPPKPKEEEKAVVVEAEPPKAAEEEKKEETVTAVEAAPPPVEKPVEAKKVSISWGIPKVSLPWGASKVPKAPAVEEQPKKEEEVTAPATDEPEAVVVAVDPPVEPKVETDSVAAEAVVAPAVEEPAKEEVTAPVKEKKKVSINWSIPKVSLPWGKSKTPTVEEPKKEEGPVTGEAEVVAETPVEEPKKEEEAAVVEPEAVAEAPAAEETKKVTAPNPVVEETKEEITAPAPVVEETKEEITASAPVVADETKEEITAPEETKEEITASAPVEEEVTAPAVELEPEEVSIWGVPLLADEKSDVVLLKFLRARDFKVKEAFAMLRNTVRWQQEFKIDTLLEEDLGTELDKVVYISGVDKEGHPVCYNVYGEFQNKELYQSTFADSEKPDKFLRWRVQFLEKTIRKELDLSPDGVSTFVQVNDLKASPGPFKRDLKLATNLAVQLLQDNYPEFVAKQVFINVPWWYLAAYKMISPFFTQRTKSKFVFAGPSRSAETLFKYIAPEQVPIQYGGLKKDGEQEFTTADTATEEFIKPSTKTIIEFPSSEASTLVWEARVIGWDVLYGAEFVPTAEGGYTVIIQKPSKISPVDETVLSGSYKTSEAGKVVITFDNSTSSKKKKLLYRSKTKPLE